MDKDPESPPQFGSRDEVAHSQDRALVQDILEGSTEAWHAFIDRYSRLILAVIHRYVGRYHEDEARSLYADVLESLYRGKLASFEGRAALSTWLVLVTRNAVVDHLRHELGGRELYDALKGLDPFERDVFRRYYIEGLSFGAVRRLVRERGALVTTDRLLEVLRHIDVCVAGRSARRLAYDLRAQSVGGASGRLLEYLDHARTELEERSERQGTDYESLDREARATLSRVQAELSRLPHEERRLLTLRFEQGWTAQRIAEELGFEGQRTVYTVLDRVVRGLRRALSLAAPRRVLSRPRAGDVDTVRDQEGSPR